MLARRLVDRAPPLLELAAPEVVLAQGQVPQLPLELDVALQALGRERPRLHRGQDRASRLVAVAAVREAAGLAQRLHVREGAAERVRGGPELQLAKPRRVDEPRAR